MRLCHSFIVIKIEKGINFKHGYSEQIRTASVKWTKLKEKAQKQTKYNRGQLKFIACSSNFTYNQSNNNKFSVQSVNSTEPNSEGLSVRLL